MARTMVDHWVGLRAGLTAETKEYRLVDLSESMAYLMAGQKVDLMASLWVA